MCSYKHYFYEPVTVSSTVINFLTVTIVTVCGLLVNSRFRKKLEKEKRNRLPGRKGNVVEPIMRWYLILSIAFWPYHMFFFWNVAHKILPSEWFKNCWLLNLMLRPITIGTRIIYYNSFFVALIRYIYIVHRRKANNWDFEKIGKLLRRASFAIPIAINTIVLLTQSGVQGLRISVHFKTCVATSEGLNNSFNIHIPPSSPPDLTMKYLPRKMIDVMYFILMGINIIICMNIPELYMYSRIFSSIKR